MRPRSIALVAAAVAALAAAGGTSSTAGAGSPALAAELARALSAPGIDAGRTGALAVDLATGETVFRRNAAVGLVPASAEKLAVSLAALRVLGPRYRFRTEVVGSGSRVARVWEGDLYLVGGGDPTLRERDLDVLARRVRASGIRRVTGRILGDERRFDALRAAPGWKPEYLGLWSRPLSALSVDGAERRGPNASAAAAARAFGEALARHGVAVDGAPSTGRAPGDGVVLAHDVSKPLAVIARRMNTESDNFTSELVLKELGTTIAERGSTAAGARVVRAELAEAGVPLAGVRIVDGSGLSRLDRLTANALVGILLAGIGDPALDTPFLRSLAVAGVSGTLEERLDRPPTRGRVAAKTGTTLRASALAGFVDGRYAFAIVHNGSPVPYWTARAAQDRFVTVLARP